MSNVFSYIGISLVYLASLLPYSILYFISDVVYVLIYHVIGYRRKVVRNNIRNSFPNYTEVQRLEIEKKFYHHLCDMIFENAKLLNLRDSEIQKRFTIKNSEEYFKLIQEGKSISLVFGHYHNWEYTAAIAAFYSPTQMYGIYKKLSNSVFDKMYFRMRSRKNFLPIEMAESTKFILKKAIKPFAVILITDQTPSNWELSYWRKFLNQDTPIFLGTEKISQKLDNALVFIKSKRLKRGYLEYEFVVLANSTKDMQEYEITNLHTEYLEKQILEEPAYWLWSHRRWKHNATDAIKKKFNLQ